LWQIDYLDYTFSITPSNSLLIFKYAVVLQNPSKFGLAHTKTIRPRFVINIKDSFGNLIDPICGTKEDFADSTIIGYKNCSESDALKLGGINGGDSGDYVYREWTTVGVDLRKFIVQNITLGFETWDCGHGGHFGYAYVMAKCDSLGIKSCDCSDNGAVKLTAPDGFAYKWLPGGESTQTITINNAKVGDIAEVELTSMGGCKTILKTVINPQKTVANFVINPTTVLVNSPIYFTDSSYCINIFDQSKSSIVAWHWNFGDSTSSTTANIAHSYTKPGDYKVVLTVFSAGGCSDSIIKYVKVLPDPLAVAKPINETNESFAFYPNPSNGIFTVELKKENKATMQVFDITGKVIKSVELNKNELYLLDLSDYTKGVYMIKMNGEQQCMQKIILQ
jgi:PKD repeat protein